MTIKILFLLVFFAMMLGVGLHSRRRADSVNSFVLGGRSIGPWMSAFSYGTSYFSAVVFVGYAGQFGFRYGIASTWIGLGNALIGSLLAWLVLGRRTRVMSKHLESSTMPDFFGKRYGSRALKIVASAIVFVFLVPYTASIYNGLSRLFEMAFGIPYVYCVIGMALLTAVYVVLGGLMATAITDFIQGIIMLGSIVLIIAAVLESNGGFMEALGSLSAIPSESPATLGQQGAYASFFGADPKSLLGVVILTSLGTWGLPQMVHKFYTIKSEKAVHTGTIVSTLFALVISGGCYFLGGFSRLYGDQLQYDAAGNLAYDSIIPTMLSSLGDVLIAITLVLVLSASMSTLASLVLSSSSTLCLDFLRGSIIKNMSEKAQLLWLRGLVLLFILISVLLALDPPTFIAQLMGISWGALAGAFLAPFLYGLYWKRMNRLGVWASFFWGLGITLGNLFLGISSSINAGAVAMLGSLLIAPLAALLGKKPEPELVKNIFRCYDEKILVSRKYHLRKEE
ncbi:MAG: sodium/solute symporter [Bacillota bacterium]|nr:sodium/solute symporter [Bacillota bacterium]